jgi:hypothetical protein
MTPNWREIIEECRRNVGPRPRQLSKDEAAAFQFRFSFVVRFLNWFNPDKLMLIPKLQTVLRDRGRVVWGHLVFANDKLWKKGGTETLPAYLVYSTSDQVDGSPEILVDTVQAIHEPTDAEVAQLYKTLNEGLVHPMRQVMPPRISSGVNVYLTTCWIPPSHLPSGFLTNSLLPILIHPDETEAVVILPSRYWAKDLVALWSAGS